METRPTIRTTRHLTGWHINWEVPGLDGDMTTSPLCLTCTYMCPNISVPLGRSTHSRKSEMSQRKGTPNPKIHPSVWPQIRYSDSDQKYGGTDQRRHRTDSYHFTTTSESLCLFVTGNRGSRPCVRSTPKSKLYSGRTQRSHPTGVGFEDKTPLRQLNGGPLRGLT